MGELPFFVKSYNHSKKGRLSFVLVTMVSDASGWYARLDQECPDRVQQIRLWLDSWEESTKANVPIAASLPRSWPTLPAGLLYDPGAVLDRLLSRYEAVSDGRSPRGAFSTPGRLIQAILADEIGQGSRKRKEEEPVTLSLSAIPPGFRDFAEKFNNNVSSSREDEEEEGSSKTKSGVPLPFADPSCGAGLVASQIIRIHSQKLENDSEAVKCNDTLKLLEGMQFLDSSEIAVEASRRRILITLGRAGLVDLEGEGHEGMIGRNEAEMILESNIRVGDSLLDEWPWNESPTLVISRPPWIRIKDRFRGHEEGSRLRRELSGRLRNAVDSRGDLRFSALKGNVNLYRLFLERSLQLVSEGGRVRMVVPDSLLREKSSVPLRKLLVENNEWGSTWSFPDPQRIFPGISQGFAVLGITSGGSTDMMTSFGPLGVDQLLPDTGVSKTSPFLELERGHWSSWTDATWAVPRMPSDEFDRRRVLDAIGRLADQPRLSEDSNWLCPGSETIRVRVGEIDQSSSSSNISDWDEEAEGVPFIRSAHFCLEGNDVLIRHPAYDSDIPSDSIQKSHSMWSGNYKSKGFPRIACQAILNSANERRLRWAVVPGDCVLGNSVNFLELPEGVKGVLEEENGCFEDGLNWLCEQLNSVDLDLWSRAWGANSNVNNYEIERLPFPTSSQKDWLSE